MSSSPNNKHGHKKHPVAPRTPVASHPAIHNEQECTKADERLPQPPIRRWWQGWRISKDLDVFDAAVTAIAVISVFFLVDQARQTRKALDATVTQVRAIRPWVRAVIKPGLSNANAFMTTDPQYLNGIVPPAKYVGYFTLTVKNVGQSFANNLIIYTDMRFLTAGIRASDVNCEQLPRTNSTTLAGGEEETSGQIFRMRENMPGTPTIIGCVTYSSAPLGAEYDTKFTYELRSLADAAPHPAYTLEAWLANPSLRLLPFGDTVHR